MNWKLHVLGANSAVPSIHRYPSGQVLDIGITNIMIDCGEGSQLRMLEHNVKSSRISTILISHLHGDHIYGLPGLLTSYNLHHRKEPLQIIGPEGLNAFVENSINVTNHAFSYPIEIREIKSQSSQIVLDKGTYQITSFPLVHRIPTFGYRIEEKINRKFLIKEKVQELDLTSHQVQEILSGKMIKIGEKMYSLNELERIPCPRSYAYVSDTAYFPKCSELVGPVSMLYHEATFLEEDKTLAKERYHSTAAEAAKTAKNAGANNLLLGHYSSRYRDLRRFQEEAGTIFQPVYLALSGKKFIIPRTGNAVEQ